VLTCIHGDGDGDPPTLDQFNVLLSGLTNYDVAYRVPYPQGVSGSAARLLRIRMDSPLELALELPRIAEATTSFAILFFVAKRLFGIDLELRVHREELRAQLVAAKALADDADRREHVEGDAAQVVIAATQVELSAQAGALNKSSWQCEDAVLVLADEHGEAD
jgi:hypothetical protein